MHTCLCRLFRVRGRWRPIIGVLVYYMLAVVLVENVLIAWHSTLRFRSSVVKLAQESSNVDIVDVSCGTNQSSSRSTPTDIDVARILRTKTSAEFDITTSLPMTTTAALAVAKSEVKAERHVLSPITDMADLERKFYRLQTSEVNYFRHGIRRAPPGLCRDETHFVVLIHSHPKYMERRLAIRQTWGSAIRSGRWPGSRGVGAHSAVGIDRNSKFMRTCCDRMQMAFVVGLSRDPGINDAVDEEYLTHWDVVQGDFIDDYQNMTLKSLIDLKFVTERCSKVKYLLKTDDDMIINLPYLVDMLDEIALNTSRFILGPLNVGSRVYRNGKWRLTKEQFPFEFFPPYESGSAYVISADLVGELLEASRYVPSIFIDDVYITGILGRILGVQHVRRAGFAFWTSRPPMACDLIARRVVTGTKMTPINLNAIWNELQRGPYCPATGFIIHRHTCTHTETDRHIHTYTRTLVHGSVQ